MFERTSMWITFFIAMLCVIGSAFNAQTVIQSHMVTIELLLLFILLYLLQIWLKLK